MKRLNILLILVMLCCICLSSSIQANETELFFRYHEEKKSPWIGVGAAWLLPSLGHAYAGNWERGAKFLGAEVIELGIMLWAFSDNEVVYAPYYGYEERGTENNAIGSIAALAFIGTRIWEYVDAYQEVERYNKRLLQRYSIGHDLKIGKDGVTMSLSYKF